jgi:hypothetical protein
MTGLRVDEPITIIKKPEPIGKSINKNGPKGPGTRGAMEEDDSFEYESGEENEKGVGDFDEDRNDTLGANILEGLKIKERMADVMCLSFSLFFRVIIRALKEKMTMRVNNQKLIKYMYH